LHKFHAFRRHFASGVNHAIQGDDEVETGEDGVVGEVVGDEVVDCVLDVAEFCVREKEEGRGGGVVLECDVLSRLNRNVNT